VLGAGFFATTGSRLFELHAQIVYGGLQGGCVGQEIR
jgi:hypothetical protein